MPTNMTLAQDAANEETPLLPDVSVDQHAELYQRFSPARKRVILALVSLAGVVPRKCLQSVLQPEQLTALSFVYKSPCPVPSYQPSGS